MNWNIFAKILLAIVAFVVIAKYIAPLLVPLEPPLGVIGAILLYVGVLAWLLWGPEVKVINS